jgi:hypothetical protein
MTRLLRHRVDPEFVKGLPAMTIWLLKNEALTLDYSQIFANT